MVNVTKSDQLAVENSTLPVLVHPLAATSKRISDDAEDVSATVTGPRMSVFRWKRYVCVSPSVTVKWLNVVVPSSRTIPLFSLSANVTSTSGMTSASKNGSELVEEWLNAACKFEGMSYGSSIGVYVNVCGLFQLPTVKVKTFVPIVDSPGSSFATETVTSCAGMEASSIL